MWEERFKNLIRHASGKVVLSKEEKTKIRLHLLQFIEESHKNPVVSVGNPMKGDRFWFARFLSMPFQKNLYLKLACVSLVAFLFAGTGISFAAQNALPGDILYPIKTQVNERIFRATRASDIARAQYDIDLAKLRLKEIETVVSDDRVSEKHIAEAETLLKKHIEDISQQVNKIKTKDKTALAIEVSSDLEASLNAHTKILDNLSIGKDNKTEIDDLNAYMKEKSYATGHNRESEESRLSNDYSTPLETDARNKLSLAKSELKEVSQLIIDKKKDIPDTAYIKIQEKIAAAEDSVVQAEDRLEAKDYSVSFIFSQSALRHAREIKTYMSVQSALMLGYEFPTIDTDNKTQDDQ